MPPRKASKATKVPRAPKAPKAKPSGRTTGSLLRDLDVHREELATQNEDLRRANAALSLVKERYADLYGSAPVAYFTVDTAGKIVEANLAGAELFDIASRNILFGRAFDDLVVPSSRASFRDFRRRVVEQGGRLIHETVLSMGTRRFPVRIVASRLGGASPESECLLCVTDETERRHHDDERRELELRVAEAHRVESLGVLAGGIAHDFNNILSVALASAELVLLDVAPSSRTHEGVREIRGAILRAGDLSSQMLAYTGRGRGQPEPLDISEVVRSVSGLLASSAPKGTLTLDLTDGLPPVAGESAQIRQIVLNLVLNAAEAISHETGAIKVRTRYEPAPAARPSSSPGEAPPGTVLIEVSDDGRGMDEATRHRAFDPFFSTKFTGRGLGLAVVHGNVRAHGGTVTIESGLRAGTTVRVSLPATRAAQLRRAQPANDVRKADAWRGRGLVLVVDDEDAVRSAAGRLLQRVGFDVCFAADGMAALAVARHPPAALVAVLLDLTMPGLSGQAVLLQLKAFDRALPVVLMSGYSSATLDDGVIVLADGFVSKPFTLKILAEAMQTVVERAIMTM